jgi:hypothetical protein
LLVGVENAAIAPSNEHGAGRFDDLFEVHFSVRPETFFHRTAIIQVQPKPFQLFGHEHL